MQCKAYLVPDSRPGSRNANYLQGIKREIDLVAQNRLQEYLVEMQINDARVIQSSAHKHAQPLEDGRHVPMVTNRYKLPDTELVTNEKAYWSAAGPALSPAPKGRGNNPCGWCTHSSPLLESSSRHILFVLAANAFDANE